MKKSRLISTPNFCYYVQKVTILICDRFEKHRNHCERARSHARVLSLDACSPARAFQTSLVIHFFVSHSVFFADMFVVVVVVGGGDLFITVQTKSRANTLTSFANTYRADQNVLIGRACLFFNSLLPIASSIVRCLVRNVRKLLELEAQNKILPLLHKRSLLAFSFA